MQQINTALRQGLLTLLFLSLLGQLQAQQRHSPFCQHNKQYWLEARASWDNRSPSLNYNSRSDTFDILHYDVQMDLLDFSLGRLQAACMVEALVLTSSQRIELDLLGLQVDSVQLNGQSIAFQYNDTLLRVPFAQNSRPGDTLRLRVFYQGQPQVDGSGWGGFYFDSGYAFNLGVGFQANPHNYGRVWHPCFDSFRERASYRIHIRTASNRRAHCSGVLVQDTLVNGLREVEWYQAKPIPTYLLGIAVGNYAKVQQQYAGNSGAIPIELAAHPKDTSKLKAAFVNLDGALSAFENWYGDYRWDKVGYVIVPFNGGAMEHVSNIAYPTYGLNGLSTETLMAHELAHSWWGNLITCETAEDMWINEGMASYSEQLFIEKVYGRAAYIEAVKDNHYNVLRTAHLKEGGFRPVSGVPHEYTYGSHVYNKGAVVAHNLRWYMGDSNYLAGIHFVMDSFQYRSINSTELRDALTQKTGVALQHFFDDWVFSPGFCHFSIDSTLISSNGQGGYNLRLNIRQKLRGRQQYMQEVPIPLSFWAADGQKYEVRRMVSGAQSQVQIDNLPFYPEVMVLNESHALNQARFDDQRLIRQMGSYSSAHTGLTVNTTALNSGDSVLLRLEHHWVAPDSFYQNPSDLRLSNNHYWSVKGRFPFNYAATLRLNFNNSYDSDLLANGTDSLLLLYRPHSEANWEEHPNYQKVVLGTAGYFVAQSLLPGQYAFANGAAGVEVEELANKQLRQFKVFPNTAQNQIFVELQTRSRLNETLQIELYNLKGQLITSQKKRPGLDGKLECRFELEALLPGSYIIQVSGEKGTVLGSKELLHAK